MLAIVAPSFNHVSETFIADHARTLAPGRTVLVCQDSTGAETYGCPVLSHVQPAFTSYGPLDARLKPLLHRLRRRFGAPLAFDDRMRLAEFLKVQKVEVVLAEYGTSGVMVADVCARLGLPLHVIYHGMDASALLRFPTIRRRYRAMFPKASGVICVSRYLADRLVAIGCPEELISVVPCGVETSRFTPGAPEPGRLVAVGRLVDKKAPHLTIRAFAEVAARHPRARLDIVGEGPLRPACEAAIAEAGLEGRVTLHGAQPHAAIAALMQRAAVFVQHSVTSPTGDTEGFPVAIAEAMASGLPVVSTRHSGIPDGVADGVTGLLVAEGDVAGMAAALDRLLGDPALAARMGAAGRRRAVETLDQVLIRRRLRGLIGLPEPAETGLMPVRQGAR